VGDDSQLLRPFIDKEKFGFSECRNYVCARMVAGISGGEFLSRRDVTACIFAASLTKEFPGDRAREMVCSVDKRNDDSYHMAGLALTRRSKNSAPTSIGSTGKSLRQRG
jgi:hypothetical protein